VSSAFYVFNKVKIKLCIKYSPWLFVAWQMSKPTICFLSPGSFNPNLNSLYFGSYTTGSVRAHGGLIWCITGYRFSSPPQKEASSNIEASSLRVNKVKMILGNRSRKNLIEKHSMTNPVKSRCRSCRWAEIQQSNKQIGTYQGL
jgi:hypothetical protein